MEYIIAVFSIRTDTMNFYNFLNRNRINCTIIETPKQVSASCGISVKFATIDLPVARRLLPQSGAKSFIRFYMVSGFYGRQKLTPIN